MRMLAGFGLLLCFAGAAGIAVIWGGTQVAGYAIGQLKDHPAIESGIADLKQEVSGWKAAVNWDHCRRGIIQAATSLDWLMNPVSLSQRTIQQCLSQEAQLECENDQPCIQSPISVEEGPTT
jgi:hypothetical protein